MQLSGFRLWMKRHLSWPLVLALSLSLLLHVLILSEIGWQNWIHDERTEPEVLQARLLPPPLVQASPVQKIPSKPSKPQPRHALKPAKAPPPRLAVEAETAQVEREAVEPQEIQQFSGDNEAQARQVEIEAWHEMDHPEVEEESSQLPPYQHVSTDFSVFVNGDARPAGSAKIEYSSDESSHYTLHWVVEGKGLLKLLYPSLEQQSQGEISRHGLKPYFYRYAFGSRASKTYEANFDWEINIITLKTSKGEQRQDLRANTQDLLSFMYQFMFVPPLQEMHVTLTNGRRLGEYEYVFEGEESMDIADQTIQTVHIVHTRGDTDEKVELWLASDYRYVPVKIKKLEKNGMVIEQVATRLIAK